MIDLNKRIKEILHMTYKHNDTTDLLEDIAAEEIEKLLEEEIKNNIPVTILGKTLDEVVVILSALELERVTDIKVTMRNLDTLAKKLRADMHQATQKALNNAVNSTINRAAELSKEEGNDG